MLLPSTIFWIVWTGLVLQRLGELWLSARHTAWMRAQGGVEFGREHYVGAVGLMVALYLGLVAEHQWQHTTLAASWPVWASALLLAHILRVWSMAALGKFWNTRIWVLPGATRIRRGPYRFVRHPIYVAIALEIIALPLLWQCVITTLISAVGFAWFLRTRIPAEEKALDWLTRM